MEGHAAPLVIGYRDFADYPAHSPHLGAIAGRSANRIRNARFDLDGTTYEVEPNFRGFITCMAAARGLAIASGR